jgi:hypothetical protein
LGWRPGRCDSRARNRDLAARFGDGPRIPVCLIEQQQHNVIAGSDYEHIVDIYLDDHELKHHELEHHDETHTRRQNRQRGLGA